MDMRKQMTIREGGKYRNTQRDLCSDSQSWFFLVAMDEKPNGFDNWHDAIEAVVDARAANLRPDQLDEYV